MQGSVPRSTPKNHCFRTLKFDQISNLTASNLLKLCQCQEWHPLNLLVKILTLVPKNYVTTLVFARRIEGKVELKMVVLEVVETRDTIKFCVKLGYKPTEMFSLSQRGGGCFRNEMK